MKMHEYPYWKGLGGSMISHNREMPVLAKRSFGVTSEGPSKAEIL